MTAAALFTHPPQALSALTPTLGQRLGSTRLIDLEATSVHRAVRVTGRSSAVLFVAAQFSQARRLPSVGAWPTMLGIYAFLFTLATTEWAGASRAGQLHASVRRAGSAASGLIGAMLTSSYLGQATRSRWNALPATIIGAAVLTNLTAAHRHPNFR